MTKKDINQRGFDLKNIILTMAIIILAIPVLSFAGQNEISATFVSYHTDRETDYNESNPGLYYARYAKKEAIGGKPFLFCGAYDNSEYRLSVIAGGGVLWGSGILKASLLLGAVTGYDQGSIVPAAALRLHISKAYIVVIPDVYNDQIVFGLGVNLINF